VGGRVRRLVQPPAPPQRDQIRDTPATSQWPGCGDQPPPRCRLRTSQPAQSTALVTSNSLLALARCGLDQSTTSGRRIQTSIVDDDYLNCSRSVIFPGIHRPGYVGVEASRDFTNRWNACNVKAPESIRSPQYSIEFKCYNIYRAVINFQEV